MLQKTLFPATIIATQTLIFFGVLLATGRSRIIIIIKNGASNFDSKAFTVHQSEQSEVERFITDKVLFCWPS
jgi:hypothetical protein